MALSRWSIASLFLLLVGAAWIWASKAPMGGTTNGGIPAPHRGFQAPDFSLESMSGEVISLSGLRGRPVLVNLWASWCSPCKAEMPAMQRVYEAYRDKGFTILAVNATHQDRQEQAISFAEQYELTFPILFDLDGKVSQLYQLRSLPTSFFIDAEGIIQEVVIGGPMAEALLLTRVESLLSGK